MSLNWNADKNATKSKCLTYDSNCFSNFPDTIIVDHKETQFYTTNPCIFPFKHSGKTYNSCTRDTEFWCATSVDADLELQTSGLCEDFCPLEGIYFC